MKPSALRLITNKRAILKLAKVWPNNLPPPVHASDTRAKEIAVSALCGLILRDGSRLHCSDISNEEAADLAAWINKGEP